MMRSFSLALLAMLITVTLTGMLVGDTDGEIPSRTPETPQWAMPGGGPRNSHNVSMNYSGLEPYIKWGAEPVTYSDRRCGSPVISGDGSIYYTRGPELFKVDPEGEMIWSLDLSSGEGSWNLTDPALDRNGNIVVWHGNGELHSITPEGDISWTRITDRIETGEDVHPVPVGDRIYFSGIYKLYSFNISGEIVEEINITSGYLRYSPVIDTNGTIYLVSSENELMAYHENGTLSWTHPMNDNISSPPTIRGDGSIYICESRDNDLYLHCINEYGMASWSSIFMDSTNFDQSISVDDRGNAHLIVKRSHISSEVYQINATGSMTDWHSLNDYVQSPVWVSDHGMIFIQMLDSIRILGSAADLERSLDIPAYINGTGGMAFDIDGNVYLTRGTLYCIGMAESSPPSFIGGRIEEQFVDEDEDLIMDLYHRFSDAEDLLFEYECDNPTFNVTIYDDLIHFRFTANYSGEGNARIKAISCGDDGEFGTGDDTFTWTNWFKVTVLPVNDPPLLMEVTFPPADEGVLYRHELKILDNDSDADHTTIGLYGSDWLYVRGHFLEGTPPKNDIRSDSFELLLTDEEGATSTYERIEIEITDINDPPYLDERDPMISFPEDTNRRVDVGTTWDNDIKFDDPEDDILTFTVTAGAHLITEVVHLPSNGIDFIVESEEDWYGFSNITSTVSDGEHTITVVIPVEVTAKSDPLKDLVIIPDIPLEDVDDGTLITLTCEFIDPDLKDQDYDYYRYYWNSNISGDLGEEREISFYLEPGEHRIRLEAWRPSSYSTTITYLKINVTDDGIDNAPGPEDEVEDYPDDSERLLKVIRDVTLVHLLIYGFFLLVPLFSFIIHMMIRKARSGKAQEDIPQGDPPKDEVKIEGKEVEE